VFVPNEEHLAILREGVKAWNEWRNEHDGIKPNLAQANLSIHQLTDVDFSQADLTNAHLDRAVLINANFRKANLSAANLSSANMTGADLSDATLPNAILGGTKLTRAVLKDARAQGASFERAILNGAQLNRANLMDANLCEADLSGASLDGTNLALAKLARARFIGASLVEADIRGASLENATLHSANLTRAKCDGSTFRRTVLDEADMRKVNLSDTILADLDLANVRGLDSVTHSSPSTIGMDTIWRSRGVIPEMFLRGCGLSNLDIEWAKLARVGLDNEEINNIAYDIYQLRATQAVQINPLFISYNHDDGPFVDKMEQHLNGKGVRFWRDVHHATAGRLDKIVDRAMRLNPTMLLVLSEHSVNSDWVEYEAAKARELEKEMKRDVLCPVALDDSWKNCDWSELLRRQIMKYHILPFAKWQDNNFFARQFNKLIEGLHIFYQDEKPKRLSRSLADLGGRTHGE
jgi:uncharacterized protein YjbI with pentapeptide repeats